MKLSTTQEQCSQTVRLGPPPAWHRRRQSGAGQLRTPPAMSARWPRHPCLRLSSLAGRRHSSRSRGSAPRAAYRPRPSSRGVRRAPPPTGRRPRAISPPGQARVPPLPRAGQRTRVPPHWQGRGPIRSCRRSSCSRQGPGARGPSVLLWVSTTHALTRSPPASRTSTARSNESSRARPRRAERSEATSGPHGSSDRDGTARRSRRRRSGAVDAGVSPLAHCGRRRRRSRARSRRRRAARRMRDHRGDPTGTDRRSTCGRRRSADAGEPSEPSPLPIAYPSLEASKVQSILCAVYDTMVQDRLEHKRAAPLRLSWRPDRQRDKKSHPLGSVRGREPHSLKRRSPRSSAPRRPRSAMPSRL